MVIQAETLTPQDFLDEADRVFEPGHLREGSRLMWEAMKAGIGFDLDARQGVCELDTGVGGERTRGRLESVGHQRRLKSRRELVGYV